MKPDLHPIYNKKVPVTCSCGNKFHVSSTVKEINIEVCSGCHPYYTGKHKLVDVAGRIDQFNKRLAKAEKSQKNVKNTHSKTKKTAKKDNDSNIVKIK